VALRTPGRARVYEKCMTSLLRCSCDQGKRIRLLAQPRSDGWRDRQVQGGSLRPVSNAIRNALSGGSFPRRATTGPA